MKKEKTKKDEVVVVAAINSEREVASVESFISQAIEKNLPVETMERLFALREKVKAERAKEAFVHAMSVFQGECPVIEKTKPVMNKDGVTIRYKYAPIDAIVEQIKVPLAKAGLAYTWTVKNEPGKITAIALITHQLGHSESSSFEIPIDQEGYMTAPQKVASALTFAKRYSLCNALGISTGDEDTDATDVGKESEAVSIKSKITFRLRTLGEKTETRELVEEAVKRLTTLELEEKNFEDIASRLQVLITEKNEDKKVS